MIQSSLRMQIMEMCATHNVRNNESQRQPLHNTNASNESDPLKGEATNRYGFPRRESEKGPQAL